MTKVDALELAAWTLVGGGDPIAMTEFRMGAKAYATLIDWTRATTGRENEPATAVLRGLHEVLALFAPDAVYLSVKNGAGLTVHFHGDAGGSDARLQRVRMALGTWLGTIYPGKQPGDRARVADSALRTENWSVRAVGTGLRGRGAQACDAPADTALWDALVGRAAAALAGREVTFPSGAAAKRLVPTVPTSGPYEGIELVAFPPNASAREPGKYWSEVVTLCTASFPDRDGVSLLAHMSMRNWGEVRGAKRGVHRSLDVFLPQVDDFEGAGPLRHGAFALSVKGEGAPGQRTWIGNWKHREEENVFSVLARLTGMGDLADQVPLAPAVTQDGAWVLPRLGTVHGDKWLPGATGLPMPDGRAFALAVGSCMEEIGLAAVPPVRRHTFRHGKGKAPVSPFAPSPDEAKLAARRAAVARAVRLVNGIAEDGEAVLDVFLFAVSEEATGSLRAAVTDMLGEPSSRDGAYRWSDGLAVCIHDHAAGSLSESLFRFPEQTDEDRARFPIEKVWRAELARRRSEANAVARRSMEEWARTCRSGVPGICCAVLEIPEEFEGRYEDPFMMARQVLAANRFLVQVCLAKEPRDPEEAGHRYKAAFADLLRALGVVPILETEGQAVAALTVAQLNGSVQAGMRVVSQAVPLAAQVRDGVLHAALPGGDGLPEWRTYAETYLTMMAGSHRYFERGRGTENQARFAAFWDRALQDIENHGGGLVLVDAVTGRQRLTGMSNGHLMFDRLDVSGSNTPILPKDLPRTRMARVTHQDAKLPSYFHAEDAGWTSGLFAWDGSTRTAFGLKPKPPTNNERKAIATTSRHAAPGANEARVREDQDRKFAAIDETCAFFLQKDDDPWEVLHRVQALRGFHVQYKAHTSLPYPLHELALLKNAVTS